MDLTNLKNIVLRGRSIRLEPLEESHVEALAEASAADPSLYQWTPVPQGREAAAKYVATALEWRAAGTAIPFAIIRARDGVVIGSTRLYDLEEWDWPAGHPRYGRGLPDVSQIGYTWFARSAIQTGANTEAKFLMLRHSFEAWDVLRVCLHTDSRNARSRVAIERIGGKFEGIIRAHKLGSDFAVRDSVRYSIIASEWPAVKQRLISLMDRSPERLQSGRASVQV